MLFFFEKVVDLFEVGVFFFYFFYFECFEFFFEGFDFCIFLIEDGLVVLVELGG